LAGLFEGEGYITLRLDCRKPRVLLGVSMTDEDVIRRFWNTTGLGRLNGPYAQRGFGTKPVWRWITSSADEVETMLNRMWLGLGERRHARAVEAMTTLRLPAGETQSLVPTALLPTPRTSDTNGAGQHGDGGLDLRTAVTLLPTPRASDGEKGGPNQRGSSGDLMLPSAVMLLPTPMASDSEGGPRKVPADRSDPRSHGPRLRDVAPLLPTPTAMDSRSSGKGQSGTHGTTLTDAARTIASTGPDTPPPSNGGNTSPDDELPIPLF